MKPKWTARGSARSWVSMRREDPEVQVTIELRVSDDRDDELVFSIFTDLIHIDAAKMNADGVVEFDATAMPLDQYMEIMMYIDEAKAVAKKHMVQQTNAIRAFWRGK